MELLRIAKQNIKGYYYQICYDQIRFPKYNNTNMKEFITDFWKSNLPDDWSADHEAECDSLYHPDGPGILQVSALLQENAITQSDLKEFAKEHVDSGASLETITAGSFDGITISYDVDENYWREWYLKAGNLFLFVTYHCPLADEGNEDDIIDTILETFQTIEH